VTATGTSTRTEGAIAALRGLTAGAVAIAATALPLAALARRAATVHPPPPLPVTLTEPAAMTPGSTTPTPPAAPPRPHVFRVADLAAEPGIELLTGTFGKRTALSSLQAAGLAAREALRVARAFERVHRLDRAGAGETFVVARRKDDGRVVAVEVAASPGEVWQARADGTSSALEAQRLDLLVEQRRVTGAVMLGDDLRKSLTAAGLRESLELAIDDALEGHLDRTSLRPGARLRLVVTEEWVEGEFSRTLDVDAVELVPAPGTKRPPLRVYAFGKPAHEGKEDGRGHARHWDAHGRQPYRGAWRSPIPMARISSRYNPRRMHPVLHVVMPHNGVDYAAPAGTPVYAASAGEVRSVGMAGPNGNMVQILHERGLVTAYCHLSRFAPGLHPGQHVEARTLVGYVGQTGRATGPHLHFAVKRGDVFLDPMSLKMDGVRVIAPKDRDAFQARRAELDALLDAIPLPGDPLPAAADGGAEDGDEAEPGDEADPPLGAP
jgi:murein DD-endopeptidase MepM/ murein hydrolase activator NlpD